MRKTINQKSTIRMFGLVFTAASLSAGCTNAHDNMSQPPVAPVSAHAQPYQAPAARYSYVAPIPKAPQQAPVIYRPAAAQAPQWQDPRYGYVPVRPYPTYETGSIARPPIAYAPPPLSDKNNACTVLKERPAWRDALRAAEARWGVPAALSLSIIWSESRFDAQARPPARLSTTSYGYSQAIDTTWDWYRKETGAQYARRDDFAASADFIGWYTSVTTKKSGTHIGDAMGHFLAYRLGHGGFARGDWRKKPEAVASARKVAERAALYERQLAACR